MMPREITIKATVYEPNEEGPARGGNYLTAYFRHGYWRETYGKGEPTLVIDLDDIPPYDPLPRLFPPGFHSVLWSNWSKADADSITRTTRSGASITVRKCPNGGFNASVSNDGHLCSWGWFWNQAKAHAEVTKLALCLGGWVEGVQE